MRFSDSVSPALASGEHYDQLAGAYHLSPDKLEGDFSPVRFARELRLFRQFCPAGCVLDVGCSTGAFLFQLKSRWPGAYGVLGTDVAEAALNHAETHGIPVLRRPFLEHDFGDARFDAITFWAVLEHVIQPKAFLEKAAALLKTGGLCFVLVPNAQSLAVRWLGGRYRYFMPEHVNWFTPATLRALVAAVSHLEVLLMKSTHFNPVVIWQDAWRRMDPVPPADRARLLKRTTGWKQSPWLAPLRLCYGALERALGIAGLADNWVVVLRKK